MDDTKLDEYLRLGKRPVRGADGDAFRAAVSGAAFEIAQTTKPKRRRRFEIAGSFVIVGAVVGGLAMASHPGLAEWLPWTPDVTRQETFEIGDATGTCSMELKVQPDLKDPNYQLADVNAAREYLSTYDWSKVTPDPEYLDPELRQKLRDFNVPQSTVLSMSVEFQVEDELIAKGLYKSISIDVRRVCSDGEGS